MLFSTEASFLNYINGKTVCVCELSPTKWGTFRIFIVRKKTRTAGNP